MVERNGNDGEVARAAICVGGAIAVARGQNRPMTLIRVGQAFALAVQLHAQRPDYHYRWISLGFENVEPGHVQVFLKRIREYGMPLFQNQVDQGYITSWKLFRVRYPNSDDREYQFVGMIEVATFQHLDFPALYGVPKDVLGEAKAAERTKAFAQAPSKLVRVQEFRMIESTDGWSKADSKVMQVRYLKVNPGMECDVTKRQREMWKPFYEDTVQAGKATGWAALQIRFRASTDLPYSWITMNGLGKLGDMGEPLSAALREKWLSKMQQVDLRRECTLVKEELWNWSRRRGSVVTH